MLACALYEQAASRLSDCDTGLFLIAHGDFDIHNALFERDSSGKLQLSAAFDWDSAHPVTWLEFCFFPAFLKIRWPTFETGRYSQMVLDHINRRQRIVLESITHLEAARDSKSQHGRPFPLPRFTTSCCVYFRVLGSILSMWWRAREEISCCMEERVQ